MAKRCYWLKLKADWFLDKRIKKLRSIAGGDTHTIIYLKMMLLSLKDEGKLYFEGVEDNFASEIAKPLIATTNLTLQQIQYPQDTAHARIYDRLLEMCVPVCFTGGNFRRVTAQQKMNRLKKLMEGGKSQ